MLKPRSRRAAAWAETGFEAVSAAAAIAAPGLLAGLCLMLAWGGWPALSTFGWRFFARTEWNPATDVYGGLGPIVGTLLTAILALALALPTAACAAVFLAEFCPRVLRRPIGAAVELLAGVPSIVYGMWGLFVFAPFFARRIEAPLSAWAAHTPAAALFGGAPSGLGLASASIVLAIMILPYMAATLRDLLLAAPPELRESAYGVGCTAFEAVVFVLLPYVRKGALGAAILGLGRALGETMAVTFVIGNSHRLPKGLFDSGSTIASTIANEFAEATSDMHVSALMALGFVLFLIAFAALALGRALIGRGEPRERRA